MWWPVRSLSSSAALDDHTNISFSSIWWLALIGFILLIIPLTIFVYEPRASLSSLQAAERI
jgi:hypothetical protein